MQCTMEKVLATTADHVCYRVPPHPSYISHFSSILWSPPDIYHCAVGLLTGPWGTKMVIQWVILRITYMILMMEIVLGDDPYEKSCDSRGDPGNVIDKLCSILSHWKCLPM